MFVYTALSLDYKTTSVVLILGDSPNMKTPWKNRVDDNPGEILVKYVNVNVSHTLLQKYPIIL